MSKLYHYNYLISKIFIKKLINSNIGYITLVSNKANTGIKVTFLTAALNV